MTTFPKISFCFSLSSKINNSSRNFWFLKSRSFNLCDYLMIFLCEIIWDFIVIGSTYFLKYKTKPSNIFFWEILCESEGYINIFLEIYFAILNINSINSALFNFPNIDFAFWLYSFLNSINLLWGLVNWDPAYC